MNGGQDLGGMMGFGPIVSEPEHIRFHADWERRVFAMTLAMGATGSWNIDQSRFARESLPPAQYLSSSYYQIWLSGLMRLLRERGLADEQEMADGRMRIAPLPVKRRLAAADVGRMLKTGGPTERKAEAPARFKPGDRVRARNMHPQGHTRLPRYLRSHEGEVIAVRGVHVFPDSNARGEGENPQWLYTVRFTAQEVWGEDKPAGDTVQADLWEPYLEPAE